MSDLKNQSTVLIVEDESSLLSVLAIKLEHEGFKILKAKNGEEGLLLALENKPDLILLDIIMPKMDGIAMLKKLREDNWGKTTKVIILTNLSDKENIIDSIEHGTYDYLVKSDWKIESVADMVKNKLLT